MKIADRLDIAMKAAGFRTQAAFARAADVEESTLARILKNSNAPSIDTLQRLATAANVSLDWIVNGTTSKSTSDFSLTYVTAEEMRLLTQFREANQMGKSLIKAAADTAKKTESAPSTNDHA